MNIISSQSLPVKKSPLRVDDAFHTALYNKIVSKNQIKKGQLL